jgi:hypothetical protein
MGSIHHRGYTPEHVVFARYVWTMVPRGASVGCLGLSSVGNGEPKYANERGRALCTVVKTVGTLLVGQRDSRPTTRYVCAPQGGP